MTAAAQAVRSLRKSAPLRRAGIAFLLLAGLTALSGRPPAAAEFDINGPSIELRRIQFCSQCGSPLAVTNISPGAAIRCPSCGAIERRLPTKYLLTRIYQVCPGCGSRMDVNDFQTGDRLRCGACGLLQIVLPEALNQGQDPLATGRAPEARIVPGEKPEVRPRPSQVPAAVASPAAVPEVPERSAPPSTPAQPATPAPAAPVAPPPSASTPANEAAVASAKPAAPRSQLDEYVVEAPLEISPVTPPSPADFTGQDRAMAGAAPSPAGGLEFSPDLSGLRLAAKVNGRPIPEAEVELAVTRALEEVRLSLGRECFTPHGLAVLRKREKELHRQAVSRLVDRELALEAAEREGYAPENSAILERARKLRDTELGAIEPGRLVTAARQSLIVEEMRRRHGVSPLTVRPETVREEYERRRQDFIQPQAAQVRAILIYRDRNGRPDQRPAAAIAAEVAQRLSQGEDFPGLARRFSEEPFAPDGGVLRQAGGAELLPLNLFSPRVRRALAQLKPGDWAGPIEQTTALAFVRVERAREATVAPFAAVAAGIERELRAEGEERRFLRWLETLRETAAITVF